MKVLSGQFARARILSLTMVQFYGGRSCPSSKILHRRRITASLYWNDLELQIKYPHVTTYILFEERKLLQKLEQEHANNARSIAENWFSDSESAPSIWMGV